MTILENIFGKKKSTDISSLVAQEVDKIFSALSKRRFRLSEDIYSPYVADSNFLTLFNTVGEIFFPIDFLASRIAGVGSCSKKLPMIRSYGTTSSSMT